MSAKFLSIACVFLLFFNGSCQDDEEPCTREGTFSSAFFNGSSSGPVPNPGNNNISENQLYYDYTFTSPQKVIFFVIGRRTDICVNKHVNVQAEVVTSIDLQPRELEMMIYSDWGNGQYDQSETIFEGFADPGSTYSDNDELGLKQAYPDGGAVLFSSVEVAFESFGNFSQDSAYFMEHIASMKVHYTYSR